MADRIARRAFVCGLSTAAAAGLAGCGGNQTGGGAESPTGNATGTVTATATETETETEMAAETGTEEYRNQVGENASVSFAVPSDGAALTSPSVQWQATSEGVTIEEAGEVTSGTGHYHIIVNADPVTPGETIPSDDSHIHYGSGQKTVF